MNNHLRHEVVYGTQRLIKINTWSLSQPA